MKSIFTEQDRFIFLLLRDGREKAEAWERRTAEIYRNAALQAADPEAVKGAKGMEWAEKYCQASRDCDSCAD